MGNRAVKQPNGPYARFSEIVDDFTILIVLVKNYGLFIAMKEALNVQMGSCNVQMRI